MAAGARVGPYRILRLVNRGGQGSVFLGYDKRLNRQVAIKIYDLPAARHARKRLLGEAQLIASMQSPKVVQVHDVIESSEHLAMVMEYVPGCDLEDFLARVRPSLASILTIGAAIAGGLTVARQQRIVHGDLKAGNILIAATGRVKLTDFGIARNWSVADGAQLTAGSPSVISPEQYLGQALDGRSDLFALGCLLYRMLTGTHPFMRAGELDVRLLLERAPQPVEELLSAEYSVPRELLDLVSRLLQKEPRDRPPNTRIVRQVLRRVSRELPMAASNSLLEEARPCFRRESAEDIPPAVPADLGRQGRSRLSLPQSGVAGLWARLGLLTWRARAAAVLTGCLLAAVLLVKVLHSGETRVHIEQPVLRLASGAELPAEVSAPWLVAEVVAAVAERLGPLSVTGPVGVPRSTTFYADRGMGPAAGPAQEQLQLGLRCVNLICVFAVNRNSRGRQSNRQAVLFPDMPAEQWRDIVRTTTRALYP